jgi:uncharacterized tellurite resistance protein B-like protein
MPDSVTIEHFRNLVSLSAADGKITEAERVSLARIASSIGIPPDQLQIMLTHNYLQLVPQNNKDPEKQLEDMIEIALVGGDFAHSERELIRYVAQRLGFTRARRII